MQAMVRVEPTQFSQTPLREGRTVLLAFNPVSQFVSQLELYSQLQLSLWSDPIAFGVPNST